MKIIPLRQTDKNNRCTPYLILGGHNRRSDIITVIDPGSDEIILDEIERVSKDLGTVQVSQVIITHNNFEHAGGCRAIKKRYKAKIRAFSAGPEIDEPLLKDGQFIDAGDGVLEVLHTPGYSPDSLCLYAPSERTLFSGDLRVSYAMSGEAGSSEWIESLLKIACRDIETIYASHDKPVMKRGQDIILQTLERLAAEKKNLHHPREVQTP